MVRGRVQGVGYRAWTELAALEHGLAGWVRNCRDGSVEALFAGEAAAIEAMLAACRHGPPAARVDAVEVREASDDMLAQRRPGERFSVVSTE